MLANRIDLGLKNIVIWGSVKVLHYATGVILGVYVVALAFNIATILGFLLIIGAYLNLLGLLKFRVYVRDRELTKCAIQEILTIFALPVFLSPLIGYLPVLILLTYSITWFILFNRWVWRTVLRPQV